MKIKPIQILEESLANKIAAGEVIQRPEAVVKELIENSLDSGAKKISIIIKQAGKESIQIIDNGSGIPNKEVATAFTRHATSKISKLEDLSNILTFGFRGEALASIASVSQVEMITRISDEEIASKIIIHGSRIIEQSKISGEVGTSITVNNLFYNTPARRQFFKSNTTEFKHIYDVIERAALSNPEIAFQFISDDEELLNVTKSNLNDRISNLFGDVFFDTLLPIFEETELLTVGGFVGKPEFSKKTKSTQYLFLNNRFIINRTISHAIYSGYEHLIIKGNFPFVLINLKIDPAKVDVNVHPSKLEVKFLDESMIYKFVMSVVRKGIAQHTNPQIIQQLNGQQESFDTENNVVQNFAFSSDKLIQSIIESNIPSIPLQSNKTEEVNLKNTESEKFNQQYEHVKKDQQMEEGMSIWQIHNKYILAQIKSGIMIIDQHVAHERILYEKATQNFENHLPTTQHLLFTQTLHLTPNDFALMKELAPDLIKLGFEMKEFGKNTFAIDGVPTDVKPGKESTIVQEILSEYRHNQNQIKLDSRDNLAKSFACKSAIKAGDSLTENEMRVLIDQLFATKVPYVCPHGRPVMIKISIQELDKRFFRT
ncbi:MAG: DNA mismatch repair endonuclease MutL [Ignavibacteria bacterium]|nr:DNA mismatch repair endonuclease MutL [Ignavibacteria bacterium]